MRTESGARGGELGYGGLLSRFAPTSGAAREAVLGLPSPNCTPQRGVGSAFRAHLLNLPTQG